MIKIDDKILDAVKVKQPVSQVLKNETVNYILVRKNHRDHRGHREKLHRSVLSVYSVVKKTMQQFLISGKIKKSQILGSENQNPRVSAQSAFPFRFDEYYFINPNNQNFNSPQSSQITQSLAAFSLYSGTEKNQQRTQRTRNELTLPGFVLVRTGSLFFSVSFMNDSPLLTLRRDLESRCDDDS